MTVQVDPVKNDTQNRGPNRTQLVRDMPDGLSRCFIPGTNHHDAVGEGCDDRGIAIAIDEDNATQDTLAIVQRNPV